MPLSIRGSSSDARAERWVSENNALAQAQMKNPATMVQSRMTQSRALISALQASSEEAQASFNAMYDDIKERTEILRSILKECRNLRMAMVLSTKGEITDSDKSKSRPPQLHQKAGGGCSEAEDYIMRTLLRAREMILEDYQARVEESEAVGTANLRLDEMVTLQGQVRVRDEDELTVISNWNTLP